MHMIMSVFAFVRVSDYAQAKLCGAHTDTHTHAHTLNARDGITAHSSHIIQLEQKT